MGGGSRSGEGRGGVGRGGEGRGGRLVCIVHTFIDVVNYNVLIMNLSPTEIYILYIVILQLLHF